jgi:hypothetical protein
MKIPKWMRKPQGVVCHSHTVYCSAAKLLEVEARLFSRRGDKRAALALRLAASAFYRIGSNGEAPDVAFGWEEEVEAKEAA